MIRTLLLLVVLGSVFILPAFADSTCTAQNYANGTIITCPNNSSNQSSTNSSPTQSSPVSSASGNFFKDYFGTILGKLQSASQQSGLGNQQLSNVTTEATKAVYTAIDLFSIIKYLLAALIGVIAPYIFHQQVPNWVVPLFIWVTLGITAYCVLKHIWKIVIIGVIVIIAIFIVLLFGSNFFFQ